MKKHKLLARLIAFHGVRNTELENLHSGIAPSSKTGDFSDVKVVTPYGEIPWNELSRFKDQEMRNLMLDIEKSIERVLDNIPHLTEKFGSENEFLTALEKTMFGDQGVSWDRPEEYLKKYYGDDYKSILGIVEGG